MLSLLLPAALLLQPTQTLAYLTPEDVLLQQQTFYYATDESYLTPNTRRVQAQVAERAAERMAQHPSTFYDLGSEQAASSLAATAQSSSSPQTQQTSNAAAPVIRADDPVMDRLILRLERDSVNANDVLATQERPLTPTGPATIVLIVLGAAVLVTALRALHMRGWKI